ncbi:MAG: hypothetical protein IKJ77_00140 [Firmicutes bacterium]|nr:hypothetical protein [Bacillota bacterium]
MDNKPIFGDPSPVLTTIFATLCFCFWANTMGYFTEGATLAIGVLQLGVFVSYTCGGLILLRNGNAFGGNMFMVFATVFGGIAGLTHVIMSVLPATIPFCYQVCGLSFIVAGFLLLCMVPGMCYSSIADVISFLSGGLGVLAYGLTGFGLAPASLNVFGAWMLFIDGAVGMYTVIGQMNGFLGLKPFPLGKPLLTRK